MGFAVFIAFAALYLPFEDEPWSLYAALCVSYTILVFGLLWSDGKWRKYIEAGRHKARDLAQGHAVFLLAMILWIWLWRFSRPRLPDWMIDEIYRGLNYYPYLQRSWNCCFLVGGTELAGEDAREGRAGGQLTPIAPHS